MPRTAAQSDFVFRAPDPEPVARELPPGIDPVALPRVTLRSTEASERATWWVMRATWLVLLALALLCAIGPHIPAGE